MKYHKWVGKYQISAKFATSSATTTSPCSLVLNTREHPHQCLRFTVGTITHSLPHSLWFNCSQHHCPRNHWLATTMSPYILVFNTRQYLHQCLWLTIFGT